MANYTLAQGTRLYYSSSASPSVFTEVSCPTNINESGIQRNEIDVTCLSDSAKQFAPGLPDYGNVSFEINWNPDTASHAALFGLIESGDVREWKITFNDTAPATAVHFDGYISSWQRTTAVDSVVKVTVTVRVTGAFVQH